MTLTPGPDTPTPRPIPFGHPISRLGGPTALMTLLSVFLLATGCAGSEQGSPDASAAETRTVPSDATASQRVDAWIDADAYDEALEWLESAEAASIPAAERSMLLEKTWLNYGLYSMSTFEPGEMRTRMNDALRCFAKVIEINPGNRMADQQINQILSVYRTMPGRGPEPDVEQTLRALGYAP